MAQRLQKSCFDSLVRIYTRNLSTARSQLSAKRHVIVNLKSKWTSMQSTKFSQIHTGRNQQTTKLHGRHYQYFKYGSILLATSGTLLYYSQLTDQEKRILRVTLGGFSRFIRYIFYGTFIYLFSGYIPMSQHKY